MAFSTYLALKGLKKIWEIDLMTALGIGVTCAVVVYLIVSPLVGKYSKKMKNEKSSVNSLFTLPLIFAAALLSFAHGANDVANAVGPLAAINDAVVSGGVAAKASIPIWVMAVGAIGIVLGLALFGPKLIKTVGSEITQLDQMRAFSVAMAAAVTVIFASQLGLPVSSTHIAVGGIFGIGFLREYLKANYSKIIHDIEHHHSGRDHDVVEEFLHKFEQASMEEKRQMLDDMKKNTAKADLTKKERKALGRVYRQELVRRSALKRIAAAWVITVPASALMAAILFFTIRGMMLP
jgi:PiT family inorganic phosphate transporter